MPKEAWMVGLASAPVVRQGAQQGGSGLESQLNTLLNYAFILGVVSKFKEEMIKHKATLTPAQKAAWWWCHGLRETETNNSL